MNNKLFLDAMEDIREEYILSAQDRLGYLAERERSRVRPLKRIFTAALAAVLVLLCTMAAAMAVNPEFREAIISLLQIGEVERVPGIPAGVNEVKQVSIGAQVSAQYVKVEGSWQGNDDGLLVRRENSEQEHFYDLIDGELVEIGADAPVTEFHLNWHGVDLDGRFRSFVYKDRIYICDIDAINFGEGGMSIYVQPQRLGSRTDVVMLRGEYSSWSGGAAGSGTYQEGNWAWICDVETGEVQDVLAGCGIEDMDYIDPVLLAEDGKHALIRAGISSPRTPYLADLEEKTCTPLSELMELDVNTESYPGYEVTFCGSDTVLLAMPPLWGAEPASVWAYHIPSGTVTPTVVQEEGLSSIWSGYAYNWALAQKVEEDGAVTIVDLRTGGRIRLEGVNATDRCWLEANDSLTKLLWVDWEDNRVSRLGVVDLETGEFTAFEREAMDERYNEPVFWLGEDRVATMMDLRTGLDYVQPGEEYIYDKIPPAYYLCVYEF